jgi:hypothetical protein
MRWLTSLLVMLLLVPAASDADARAPKRAPAAKAKGSKGAAQKDKKQVASKQKKKKKKAKAAPMVLAEGERRFLGLEPHGPLALVRSGKLTSPEEGACRIWGRRGTTWSSLDTFGRVVGEVAVTDMDRYDVTNCDELVLRTREGAGGAGVYVAGAYEAAPIEPWLIPAGPRRVLETLVRMRDAKLPAASHESKVDVPLDDRLLSYRAPNGDEMAVIGGRGLTVLRLEKGEWRLLFALSPAEGEVGPVDMFRPLAVVDMNGDSKPEIVIHERAVDAYSDFTLTPSGEGFDVVEPGITGAFA